MPKGEKVFHVALNVVVRGKDKAEVESRATNVLLLLRQLGGAEGMEESHAAFDIFCTTAVPNAWHRSAPNA